jgi:hypothetical protein
LFDASLVGVCLTGVLTACGWFVTKRIDVRAQTKLKQAEFRRAHVQRQIEEFYGPLYSLVWQIFATNDLKYAMLRHPEMDEDKKSQIEDYFATKYFLPLHDRAKDILEKKLYLVEGTKMPESFQAYLRTALQETVQRDLWSSKNLDTSFIKGKPWPSRFYDDISSSLTRLMEAYEEDVQLLRGVKASQRQPTSSPTPKPLRQKPAVPAKE